MFSAPSIAGNRPDWLKCFRTAGGRASIGRFAKSQSGSISLIFCAALVPTVAVLGVRDVRELEAQWSSARVPTAHERVVGFPSGLSELLSRMMQRERVKRPQSYHEIIAELKRPRLAA